MNENRGLSTLTEVLSRGEIVSTAISTIKEDVFILIFSDGTQANLKREDFKQIRENLLVDLMNNSNFA